MFIIGRFMRNKFRLVITGNPGVGKHTSAKLIAKKFRGSKIIDINKVALINNAILDDNDKYGISIDLKKVSKLIAQETKTNVEGLILVGHLAPYVIDPGRITIAIVLRRSPYELISVFQQRHYTPEKARENIASEILGVSLYDSVMSFGKDKIAEVDTTGEIPARTSAKIVSLLQKKLRPQIGFVDWFSLVNKNGDLQRFLEY
jgi:adenylate kinase